VDSVGLSAGGAAAFLGVKLRLPVDLNSEADEARLDAANNIGVGRDNEAAVNDDDTAVLASVSPGAVDPNLNELCNGEALGLKT
jgi:hypothetical protein